MLPDNIELIDGDYWPTDDKECRKSVMVTFKDADVALKICRGKKVVIQAGGNCGIWARYLSQHFETVYTFEPDITNFICLNLNVPEANVIRMQAALGAKSKPISILKAPGNVGAHRVGDTGGIPVIRIDDLRLEACDLIQLDVEGYEYFCLKGAIHTIDNFKPVIMIEDKGHHKKYGVEHKELTDLFDVLGYVKYHKINRDLIMVPKEFL